MVEKPVKLEKPRREFDTVSVVFVLLVRPSDITVARLLRPGPSINSSFFLFLPQRAFLKLGFTVSALIVIGFILWSGNDQYYMNQFYWRRFQEKVAEHAKQ